MNNRKIPETMRRWALMESGHICAVCGSEAGVEVHHLEPFAKVKTHELKNLIALCPNCHHRADRGDIDRLALLEYKKKPFIKRRAAQANLTESAIKQSVSGEGNIAIGQVTGGTVTVKTEGRSPKRVKTIFAEPNTIAYYPLLQERLHERIDQLAEYRLRDNSHGDRSESGVRGKIFRDFNHEFRIEQFKLLKVDDFDQALNWVEAKVRQTRFGRINQKRSRDAEAWQLMCDQVFLLARQLGWDDARLSEEIYRTLGVTSIDQVTRGRMPMLLLHLRQRIEKR